MARCSKMSREEYLKIATKPTPEKYCAYCGKKLERRRYKKKYEDLKIFEKRKYCNRMCMRKAFVKTGDGDQDYSPAHHSSRRIAYLIENREMKCEICGSTNNIDVHHIDGNYRNNKPENLQIVCRSCHLKIHNPKKKCRICDSPASSLGYCEKHYQRFKKYGDPNHVPWSTYRRKSNEEHETLTLF